MSGSAIWSGADFLDAFTLATQLLVENRAAIDALNVYPVPDGDTGTNMSLTMQAALDEARKHTESNGGVGDIAQRIAHGALLGARGNSGVILSQIFRGFANEVSGAEKIDGRDLARALRGATDVAYKAVMRPVEGTMLSVIRVAAEAAEPVAGRDPSLIPVLEAAVAGARDALADTPNQLATLRDAGVVDSGGQGVVLTLEAFLAAARGSRPDTSVLDVRGPATVSAIHDEHDSFGYCTNFMITGQDMPYEQIRAELAAIGQSAVIVGDDRTIKAHLHTENPGRALELAVRWGALSQIKIDNMNAQAAEFVAPSPRSATRDTARKQIALVAVASGDGIAESFRSLGTDVVINGGATMNPSIDELVRAVDAAGAGAVILLPNDGNVLMAAQQVPALSERAVTVIPTHSIVEGLAAASTFNTGLPLAQAVARMQTAVDKATTVEIARADKDALVDGVRVARGHFIGLVNDKLACAGNDMHDVAARAMSVGVPESAELITVFSGKDVTDAEAVSLSALLERSYPDCDVETVAGGQPHYLFVIAVE